MSKKVTSHIFGVGFVLLMIGAMFGSLPPNVEAENLGEGNSVLDSWCQAGGGPSATRTLPIFASVDPGADFDVSITASGCGAFGQVVETLPSGFSYMGTDSTDVIVTPEDSTVKFTFIGDGVIFTYTVKASTTPGVYIFSGVVKDEYKVEYPIGGDENVTVCVPWYYDEDEDCVISKAEALNAVGDYFDGFITKDQALEVIALYFAS